MWNKIRLWFKGKKTVLFGIFCVLGPFVTYAYEALTATGLHTHFEYGDLGYSVVGFVSIMLRAMTNTPMFKKEPVVEKRP